MGSLLSSWDSKGAQLVIALVAFAIVIVVLMAVVRLAERGPGWLHKSAALAVFAGPAVLLLIFGLVYPALRTLRLSFMNANSTASVGLANFSWIFHDSQSLTTVRNTLIWVVLTPTLSAGIGLLYAVLIDRSRFEKAAKSLLFMPMAISFVGAGIIWKFVYAVRPTKSPQIGIANAVLTATGNDSYEFLLKSPLNTFFLIIVMVWIQAGFAMVVLSASIKAIPNDIVEAARLDGVNAWQMFRSITLPTIRPALVVVLTTISIAVLKVFDIVRTMTGGQFDTSVAANSMYDQYFRYGEAGKGAAFAIVIFVLVVPLVAYNIRQMRINKEVRG